MSGVSVVLAWWVVVPLGCAPLVSGDYVKRISSIKPDVAIKAMSEAAAAKSRRAIEPLVRRLYDEDPAIRMLAIGALEDITGETMGYRSYESEVKRVAAVKRWEAWLVEQGLAVEQESAAEEEN